jgi:hypothetical protein
MSSRDIVAENLRAQWPYPKEMSDNEVIQAAHKHFQKLDAPTRHHVLKAMDDNIPMGVSLSRDVATAFNHHRAFSITHEKLLKAGR